MEQVQFPRPSPLPRRRGYARQSHGYSTREAVNSVKLCHIGVADSKDKQKGAIASFVLGCDVLVILPTGYGQSLCYHCLVWRSLTRGVRHGPSRRTRFPDFCDFQLISRLRHQLISNLFPAFVTLISRVISRGFLKCACAKGLLRMLRQKGGVSRYFS